MTIKAKNDSDGILNTTTDLIRIVGKLEKKIDKRFDYMQAQQNQMQAQQNQMQAQQNQMQAQQNQMRAQQNQMRAEQAEFRNEVREQYAQITFLIRQLLPIKPN